MKFTFLLLTFLYTFSVVGQNDNGNKLSVADSLDLYFKSHELRSLYKSGRFDEGCSIFEELLLGKFHHRGSLLYGGKCCFKTNKDSLVLKIFTEEYRSIIQDFCNLNWGENVNETKSQKRTPAPFWIL